MTLGQFKSTFDEIYCYCFANSGNKILVLFIPFEKTNQNKQYKTRDSEKL